MQDLTSIGTISISAGWDKGRPVLVLKNNGQTGEYIDCRYLEPGQSSSKTWKFLYLPFNQQTQEPLPDNFRKWEKFGFHIAGEHLLAPVSELEKVLNTAEKQVISEPSQPKPEPKQPEEQVISEPAQPELEPEQPEETHELTDKSIKPNIETTPLLEQPTTDFQQAAETLVRETNRRITELARAYKDGEAIDFENIENPTSSQNVLLILNWIGRTIRAWTNNLKQHTGAERDLIDTLIYSEQHIQEKLSAMRGVRTPISEALEFKTDIRTDAELNEIRKKCSLHVAWFKGRLFGYEERTEISDVEEYDQFIPQFIKDRLFNGVARFIPFDQLPEELKQGLELIGYEVVPIEIGKTQADARVHDVQGCQQTDLETGTVIEVILPGLRRIADGEIVQKPVVIRGE